MASPPYHASSACYRQSVRIASASASASSCVSSLTSSFRWALPLLTSTATSGDPCATASSLWRRRRRIDTPLGGLGHHPSLLSARRTIIVPRQLKAYGDTFSRSVGERSNELASHLALQSLSPSRTQHSPLLSKPVKTKAIDNFDDMLLAPQLQAALTALHVTTPSPIQQSAVEAILQHKDTVVAAPHGEGKTLAYLIPLYQNMMKDRDVYGIPLRERRPRMVLLAPTKELIEQLQSVCAVLDAATGLKSASFTSRKRAKYHLSRLLKNSMPDVLIMDPKVVLRLIRARRLFLDDLRYVAIDEADAMVSSLHDHDAVHLLMKVQKRNLYKYLWPVQTQYVFTTSYITRKLEYVVGKKFPNTVTCMSRQRMHRPAPRLRHTFMPIARESDKLSVLEHILRKHRNRPRAIVTDEDERRAHTQPHQLTRTLEEYKAWRAYEAHRRERAMEAREMGREEPESGEDGDDPEKERVTVVGRSWSERDAEEGERVHNDKRSARVAEQGHNDGAHRGDVVPEAEVLSSSDYAPRPTGGPYPDYPRASGYGGRQQVDDAAAAAVVNGSATRSRLRADEASPTSREERGQERGPAGSSPSSSSLRRDAAGVSPASRGGNSVAHRSADDLPGAPFSPASSEYANDPLTRFELEHIRPLHWEHLTTVAAPFHCPIPRTVFDEGERVIVFFHEIDAATALFHRLRGAGFAVSLLHASLPWAVRRAMFADFASGRTNILCATDVAARGLDLHVDVVINFDMPTNALTYLSRAGRTARMGRNGRVYSLYTKQQGVVVSAVKAFLHKDQPLEGITNNRALMTQPRYAEWRTHHINALARSYVSMLTTKTIPAHLQRVYVHHNATWRPLFHPQTIGTHAGVPPRQQDKIMDRIMNDAVWFRRTQLARRKGGRAKFGHRRASAGVWNNIGGVSTKSVANSEQSANPAGPSFGPPSGPPA